MNWRLQTTLAGILAAIGVFIVFNPVTVVSAFAGILPWLFFAAGGVQLISILFRSRRLIRLMIIPAVTGALFIYAGLSMKFGDPTTVGPVSLKFVLALVLLGTGAAKIATALSARRSKYFNIVVVSGLLSVLLGTLVMFNWETISAGWIGVVVGLEMVGDALVMAVLALRDRDGEAAMEKLGLDPAAEAIKAESLRAAAAAKARAEAAVIAAETAEADRAAAAAIAEAELARGQALAQLAAREAEATRAVHEAAAVQAMAEQAAPPPAPVATPPAVATATPRPPKATAKPAALKPATAKSGTTKPVATKAAAKPEAASKQAASRKKAPPPETL